GPFEAGFGKTLEYHILPRKVSVAVAVNDFEVAGKHPELGGLFGLILLPDTVHLVIPYLINGMADKPLVLQVVELVALLIGIAVQMPDFIPVQLKIYCSPPGEVIPAHVQAAETKL